MANLPIESDIIAAVATPSGVGGVAIVRVSGRFLGHWFEKLGISVPPARVATRCRLRDTDQTLIDDGLLIYFAAPASFTGEDIIEFHGHGGAVVSRMVLQRFIALGARLAEPGEFSRRAYLNEKLDLAQAEAVADLIHASTAAAARSAARSLQGEFSRAIDQLAQKLLRVRSLVEATLDFPEEELGDALLAEIENAVIQAHSSLVEILHRAQQGRLLNRGMRVVLVGQPNVGKSSLLNRMARDDVAIVSELPGTTRDLVSSTVQVRGIPVHVIDTAGLREADDPIERMGIERTRRALIDADLALLITDSGQSVTTEDQRILDLVPAAVPRLRVVNKIDQTGAPAGVAHGKYGKEVFLSALSGEGLEFLEQAILDALNWHGTEDVILARDRHLLALQAARQHLVTALAWVDVSVLACGELLAEELRLAHHELGKITGQVSSDDVLGEIFSTFCIGK